MNKNIFYAASFLFTFLTQNVMAQNGRCSREIDVFTIDKKQNIIGRWDFTNQCFPSRIDDSYTPIYQKIRDKLNNWTDPNAASLPLYPSFIKLDDSDVWIGAPVTMVSSCDNPEAKEPFPTYIQLCKAGCMTGDQLILFVDGYRKISDALNLNKNDIVSLNAENSMINHDGIANLQFEKSRIKSYTRDVLKINNQNKVRYIKTDAGGYLKITAEHPLIDGNGKMVHAKDLKVGDSLLHISGKAHKIVTIQDDVIREQVYNLDIETQKQTEQIFVVEGYLSGTNRQQGSDLAEVNRYLFREQLAHIMQETDLFSNN
ncbi:MAG: hypothetical protein HQK54_00960 [Oligoflexales bacterium]|nr:hypothetical protein [Oligoflexales bacterium]